MTTTCPVCLSGRREGDEHINARTRLAAQAAAARSVCFESAASGDPFGPLVQAALRTYLCWAQEHGNWTDTSSPTRDGASSCPDSQAMVQQLDDALDVVMRFEILAGADVGRESGEAADDVRDVTRAWAERNGQLLNG